MIIDTIQLHRHALRAGLKIDEISAAIVGGTVRRARVDESHPAFVELLARLGCTADALAPPVACLAGSELAKLLTQFGIRGDGASCRCKSRAARMDALGCDWCEANLGQIVGWLREEAQKRGLPFVDAAGRVLVRRAIRNARRAAG